MKRLIALLTLIAIPAYASWYNIETGKEASRLPNPLRHQGVAWSDPTDARYTEAGWRRIQRFNPPQGFVTIAGTRSLNVVDGLVVETYQVEPVEVAQARQLQLQAWGLPQELADAYATFMGAFEQAVGAAMLAGAEIDPEAVTYQSLVAALTQLEGEVWLKTANTLTALWNVVVVHTGATAGEAYSMIPVMEYRRQNPPPEPEPIDYEDEI